MPMIQLTKREQQFRGRLYTNRYACLRHYLKPDDPRSLALGISIKIRLNVLVPLYVLVSGNSLYFRVIEYVMPTMPGCFSALVNAQSPFDYA
jgi:hypothetical protein